ncbi:RCC1/BLIP-II protein [Neolentinus lepideus HHB14362 ss-1]|uniref:RCC1/BLIP-II protein n=1 Tax=Neolentinus lepideus HHB14362 ss-1 TaxID=1314782 RepID=A0A165UQF9_9AGAM|nr:RCC1/BLIP-II protein [Neolentinus lepideus HHB14362 ss-1]
MYRNTGRLVKASCTCRLYSTSTLPRPARQVSKAVLFGTSFAIASGTVWYIGQNSVFSDAATVPEFTNPADEQKLKNLSVPSVSADGTLNSFVWGSNKFNTISPDDRMVDLFRLPTPVKWLQNVALRDLALHERHAACVDARGNVYQWGNGFFGVGPSDLKGQEWAPKQTLQGKDIVQLQLADSRVFALSASGQVYVLPSHPAVEDSVISTQPSTGASWWSLLGGQEDNIHYAEISPSESLSRREKFISISAGSDHLLALTSSGRVFTHPITKNANSHGQLGLRTFNVPDSSDPSSDSRVPVELIPKALADPYAKATPLSRPTSAISQSPNLDKTDDQHIRWCDRLFEVPSLRGVNVDQIAAGKRNSFIKTTDGRVLGWGANEYGQIGLGKSVTLETITRPTEVVLWRSVPKDVVSKCTGISAGGDLTVFTVERSDGSAIRTIDVLTCGNGQWGGLGNALYRNAQNEPGRAKNVSGLLEFSEQTQNLQPITPHAISISPSPAGHIVLTLDTQTHGGPGGSGRDVLLWGANYDWQLGNGKRSSLAVPTTLTRPDGSRFILAKAMASEVRDLEGRVWKRKVEVEQKAVAGWGNTIIYWRVC